jgi:hypothetical protein
MKCAFFALLVALAPGWAHAADEITVSTLLRDGFDIVAAVPTSIGAPGLFLRKADKLYACFVSETPTSPTLSTRYCKPVE